MRNGRIQRVPGAEAGPMRYAVYNLSIHPPINLRTNLRINLHVNLRIPGMLSSFSSRLFSSLLFALLFLVEASAQNWAGAEGLLVGKIASATGPKTMALEVLNRSSLNAALSDERFNTSRAKVFGPVADAIFPTSNPSAPAQFCALASTRNSNAKRRL